MFNNVGFFNIKKIKKVKDNLWNEEVIGREMCGFV